MGREAEGAAGPRKDTGPVGDRLLGRVRRCPPHPEVGASRASFLSDGLFGELRPEARARSGQPLGIRSCTPGCTSGSTTPCRLDSLLCLGSLGKGRDNSRPWDRKKAGPFMTPLPRPRLMAAWLLSSRMGLIRATS